MNNTYSDTEQQTMANTLLQPGPTRVVPSLTARLRKVVVRTWADRLEQQK